MGYQYVTIDGQRVERNVAEDFLRMRADFERAFPGLTLKITSGTRTDAEQERIFRDRYVTAGNVRGRRVYDTRWWNGRLWYRVSPAGTVAVPGTSNHQESGPNGPRSIDIRDTGADAGVTVRGTRRDRWMQDNAHKYQFENEGYGFREPWHKTNRGTIGVYPSTSSTPSSSEEDDNMLYHFVRESNKAQYIIVPGIYIKHIPDTKEAGLVKYARDDRGPRGLNDADFSVMLWAMGFPEMRGDLKLLPVKGAYRWGSRFDAAAWVKNEIGGTVKDKDTVQNMLQRILKKLGA